MKTIFVILPTIFILYIAVLFISKAQKNVDKQINIVICDVGQGDAILISHAFNQVLIDAGRDAAVLNCLEENMPFGDTELELVVASHADADHIGGLEHVFGAYSVSAVMMTPWGKKTDDFESIISLLSSKSMAKTQVLSPVSGEVFRIDDWVTFVVLSPQVNEVSVEEVSRDCSEEGLWDISDRFQGYFCDTEFDFNNLSIALLFKFGSISFLSMGDIEKNAEQALLAKGLIGDVDILKVSHHGAKTSTTREFLRKSRPEISVIGVAQNSQYGHPNPEVIARLEHFSQKILKTSHEGTILLTTDGKKVWRE